MTTTTIPASLTTSPLYPNTPVPDWEHKYIGITGIKLPIKLSSLLQPANWESQPPLFVSCLEQIVQELSTKDSTFVNTTTAHKSSGKGSTNISLTTNSRKSASKSSSSSSSSSSLAVLGGSSSSSSSSFSRSSTVSPFGRSSSLNNLLIYDAETMNNKDELSLDATSGTLPLAPPPPIRTSARKLSRSLSTTSTATTPVTKGTETKVTLTNNTNKDDEDIVVMMEIDQDGNILVSSPSSSYPPYPPSSTTSNMHPQPPKTTTTSSTKAASSRKRGISMDQAVTRTLIQHSTTSSSSSSHLPNVTFSTDMTTLITTTASSKKNRKVSIGEHSTTYSSSLTSDEDDIPLLNHPTVSVTTRSTRSRRSSTANTSSNPPSDNEGGNSTNGNSTDASTDSYNDVLTLIHRTELEEFHRQALRIDLAMNPLHGQSWLTSTLIDALLFRFACYFPNVTFLPCSFAAYELVQAARHTDKLRTLLVHDVLGRLVTIRPDQIGPIEEVPGYTRLSGTGTVTTTASTVNTGTSSTGSIGLYGTNDLPNDTNIPLVSPHSSTVSAISTSSTITLPSSASYSTRQRTLSTNRKASDSDISPILSPTATTTTADSHLPPLPVPTVPHHNYNKKFTSKPRTSTPATVVVPTVPTLVQSKQYSILGRHLYKSLNKPLIFFYNAGGNHWVVVRVDLSHTKRIELYEPMGKPSARANVYREAGLGLRSIPRPLLLWLDTVCPLPLSLSENGWKERSLSAITYQHQLNGFDCGVACLLYAEKCAQGLAAETICKYTDQPSITAYRELLGKYLHYITTTTTE